MPSRLAVLIVADLVDYSRMMGEDAASAIGAIRELKEKHLEPRIVEQGGEILKRMGDGWIFAFSSVTAAIEGAMTVQTNLLAHPVIKLRMGMHIGEIVEDETDFYGAGVNLAQRLQTEAPPGGIMISQDLHRQLTGELSKSFSDAGTFNFKNISLPVGCFQWRPQRSPSANEGEVPALAVEPFAFAPENGETEAATADLRDQLIFRLSQRTGIRVLDPESGSASDTVYMLRGRLRISANRGRLTLSLILRDSGNTVWTQSYDGDTSDIFAFCDGLIEKSVSELRIQINAFDDNRKRHLPDDQLSVSELRSRAASSFYQSTAEGFVNARKLTERALRLSPDDPVALAMRAHANVFLAASRLETLDRKRIDELERDLDKAVELSPRSDFIFSARSFFRTLIAEDGAGALMDAQRVLSLNPAYHLGYEARAMAHLLAGNFDDAIADLQKSVSLSGSDPLLPYRLFMLAIAYHLAGRSQDARETIGNAIQLRPTLRSYQILRAIICRALGDAAGAHDADARARQLPAEASVLAPLPKLPEGHADLLDMLSAGPQSGTGVD